MKRRRIELSDFTKRRIAILVGEGDPDECWPWQHGHSNGFGVVKVDNFMVGVHRVVYAIEHNRELHDLNVISTDCGTRDCCNPAHLIEINRSIVAHETMKRGVFGSQKLLPHHIPQIRAMIKAGNSDEVIAEIYNVRPSSIENIRIGRSWRHIE